jgi:hypothetical protein
MGGHDRRRAFRTIAVEFSFTIDNIAIHGELYQNETECQRENDGHKPSSVLGSVDLEVGYR